MTKSAPERHTANRSLGEKRHYSRASAIKGGSAIVADPLLTVTGGCIHALYVPIHPVTASTLSTVTSIRISLHLPQSAINVKQLEYTMKARFWTFKNDGPVRIALAVGQTLCWTNLTPLTKDIAQLARRGHSTGKVSTASGSMKGEIVMVASRNPAPTIAPLLISLLAQSLTVFNILNWQDSESELRDEYAELAGY